MALPLPPGLTHSEVTFLCEMETVTVVPRLRLESINLLSGDTPHLRPPHRADIPLWLALLLKKQRRANIVPPPWLHPASLSELIHRETKLNPAKFSAPPPAPSAAHPSEPGIARLFNSTDDDHGNNDNNNNNNTTLLSSPFLPSCTAAAPAGFLPYHWLEMAEALLAHAPDDMPVPAGEIRSLLRDLVEVRAAKMRASSAALGAVGDGFLDLTGVGAVELAESRGFVLGVVDGVRRIGASAEASRREEEMEALGGGDGGEESDDEMGI